MPAVAKRAPFGIVFGPTGSGKTCQLLESYPGAIVYQTRSNQNANFAEVRALAQGFALPRKVYIADELGISEQLSTPTEEYPSGLKALPPPEGAEDWTMEAVCGKILGTVRNIQSSHAAKKPLPSAIIIDEWTTLWDAVFAERKAKRSNGMQAYGEAQQMHAELLRKLRAVTGLGVALWLTGHPTGPKDKGKSGAKMFSQNAGIELHRNADFVLERDQRLVTNDNGISLPEQYWLLSLDDDSERKITGAQVGVPHPLTKEVLMPEEKRELWEIMDICNFWAPGSVYGRELQRKSSKKEEETASEQAAEEV